MILIEELKNILYEALEKEIIEEIKAVNGDKDKPEFGKIITFEGKQGVWLTNSKGKHYFKEVEQKGSLYYIKGTEQLYLSGEEYKTVIKAISPENITREQFESDEFQKEINGAMYFVKKTEDGWIVTNKETGK